MKTVRNIFLTLALCTGFTAAAWAQMGMGMRPPQIPGAFKPVVGSGGQYEITTKDGKMDMAVAVVGKESVEGADGYWMETRVMSGKGEGMISKMLLVVGGSSPGIKRMIMQMPGRPPMEMPMGMMSGMMKNMPKPDTSGGEHPRGTMLGTESITVPAGTFVCEHYQDKAERGTTDVWASAKVSPYGAVKATTPDSTMVLTKVLTNETSQIKGEPQKMNFPGMQH